MCGKRGDISVVVQGDATGCGLACVAMVAGAEYEEVRTKAIAMLNVDGNGYRTDIRDIRELLRCYGVALGRKRTFKTIYNIPSLALLAINVRFEKDIKKWHWVLCVQRKEDACVYDPNSRLKNNKRKDFWRLSKTIAWFHEIKYIR